MALENKEIETEEQLLAILEVTPYKDDQQRNELACSFIWHSNIIESCFWYIHCGRCKAQIWDSLWWYYNNPKCVIIWHKCETCIENYEKLTRQDKIFVQDPFQ